MGFFADFRKRVEEEMTKNPELQKSVQELRQLVSAKQGGKEAKSSAAQAEEGGQKDVRRDQPGPRCAVLLTLARGRARRRHQGLAAPVAVLQ